MGRYKENYEKIGFTCLVLFFAVLFPSKTYSASTIEINGYLKNYDTKKFSNVLKSENKELFIILNSSGGKLKTLFKTIDTIIKIKKKGVKVYTIIHDDHVAYAGAFLVILFSDIVFYKDVLNIGTFTPLSKETYKSKEKDFDRIFNIIGKNNKVSVNKVKNFFFNGDMFRPEVFKDTNIKFIGIETTEDIEFSVESYRDINFKYRASGFFKYLFTPNFIFIIFNITIILSFLSIYFTKNIILSVLSSILIAIFLFLSFEITINLKAVFAIFFTHFMLIFKEYVRFKYIIFILSFQLFFRNLP